MLALIVVVALSVRLYGSIRHSLWYDEFASVECSTGRGLWHETIPRDVVLAPPPRPTWFGGELPQRPVWLSLEREQHPPLYFLTLRYWRLAVGSSDLAMRSLTIAFALLAVWAIFDAGRHWFGPAAGLWAAALTAVGVPMIDHSLQVRGYVPMVALVTSTMAALARIEKRGPSPLRVIILGTAALAAMLMHYFAIGACAAAGIYALICLRGRARWLSVAALFVGAVVYLAAWGPFLLQQRANFDLNKNYLAEPNTDDLGMTVIRRVILTPVRLFNQPRAKTTTSAALFCVAYFVPFLLIRRNRAMLLIGLWLILPIALVAILDYARATRQLTLLRYVLAAAPAAYLIVASVFAVAAPMRKWLWHVLPAAAMVSCLLAIPDQAYQPNESDFGDYRKFTQILLKDAGSNDAVLFVGGARGDWFAGWLYLASSHYAERWPAAAALLNAPPSPRTIESLRKCDSIWLATGPAAPLRELLPGWELEPRAVELFIGEIYRVTPPPQLPAASQLGESKSPGAQ